MRIGVDFHGVLGEFFIPFLEDMNAKYDKSFTIHDVEGWDHWMDLYDISLEQGIAELMGSLGRITYDRIPLVDGAKEGVDVLVAEDYELHLISTQPLEAQGHTLEFLEHHGIKDYFADFHFAKTCKRDIYQKLNLDGMIDDYHVNLAHCSQLGMVGVMKNSFHNRSVEYPVELRADSVVESVGLFREHLLDK